jgi:calcium/calmodulin-dependent protein kinase I
LEKLGSGCSSEVFKCMDKLSKSTHAVKIVRSDDDEYIQISKQEFELVRSLFHDSIVKMSRCIHDEHKGSLYLVMEFIEGDTIEDFVKNFKKKNYDMSLKRTNSRRQIEYQEKVIKKDKYIKEELIHKIIKQLVEAVNYLHKNGVCHRDLKPDNLFFDPETRSIKLMDFNVSKRFIIF